MKDLERGREEEGRRGREKEAFLSNDDVYERRVCGLKVCGDFGGWRGRKGGSEDGGWKKVDDGNGALE